MSAGEILARAAGLAGAAAERAGVFRCESPPPGDESGALSALFEPAVAIDGSRPIGFADAFLAGRRRVFGLDVGSPGGAYEWNRDPLTGVTSPPAHGPGLDLYDRGLVGDVKYLWEPNRHVELVGLAQAFMLTGEERYFREVRAFLSSWWAQCPYLQGPNWSSGLELGIRLINWSLAWQMLLAAPGSLFRADASKDLRQQWLSSVYQHCHFVRRHYSRHSSANNHLVGEAAGVFIASLTWPCWDVSNVWREEAAGILEVEIARQTALDGSSREQTTSYQRFVLQFFSLCALAASARGRALSTGFVDRVAMSARFLESMRDAGGNVPMLGDADDGCAFRLDPQAAANDYDEALALAWLATGCRATVAARVESVASRIAPWVGSSVPPAGRAATERDGVGTPSARRFDDGGYYVLGDRLGQRDEVRLVVDCGPLGYLGIAAHGHADALSIWLSVGGREFLVDPGTYLYHGAPEWRAYFRGTRAHNTVTVDGMDQSESGGAFLWLRHAQSRCSRFDVAPGQDFFDGFHDGYGRLKDPVTHRRVVARDGRTFRVEDHLACNATHFVENWWHFSEDCVVSVEGGVVSAVNAGSSLRMTLPEGSEAVAVLHGQASPPAGWVSRRYGSKVPATSVRVSRRISGGASWTTVIECFPPGGNGK